MDAAVVMASLRTIFRKNRRHWDARYRGASRLLDPGDDQDRDGDCCSISISSLRLNLTTSIALTSPQARRRRTELELFASMTVILYAATEVVAKAIRSSAKFARAASLAIESMR